MRHFRLAIGSGIPSRLLLLWLLTLVPSVATAATPDEWRADLATLVSEIERIHPDPFRVTPQTEFRTAARELEARIPELSDAAVVVELQRLVASLRDGHSSVRIATFGAPFGSQFPVVIYPFEEGVFIPSAHERHAEIVGGRVTRIGTLETQEAIDRVSTVISGENEFTILDRVPNALTRPAVLHALGITSEPDRLELTVEMPDGAVRTASISPVPADAFTFRGPETLSDGAVSARTAAAAPRHLRDPMRNYWYEHLPEEKTLYVQFNRVRNDAHEPLGHFFERVYRFADEHDVERFVLDIRHNHGGNNQLVRPLIHGLIKRDETINRSGHFFVIFGRGTFSAAISTTAWLEEHTRVTFVGEPAGSAPIHFGDAEQITLPHSGIVVSISEWEWQTRLPWDSREWFAPHLAAPPTFADYVAGRDPAMEMIRSEGGAPSFTEQLDAVLKERGVAAMHDAYRAYKERHPDRWGMSSEGAVNRLGYELLMDGRHEEAIAVFELNTVHYPKSANTWDSLAEGHLEAGNRDRAIELYEKAIEVDPAFENAHRMLAQLTGGSSDHPRH